MNPAKISVYMLNPAEVIISDPESPYMNQKVNEMSKEFLQNEFSRLELEVAPFFAETQCKRQRLDLSLPDLKYRVGMMSLVGWLGKKHVQELHDVKQEHVKQMHDVKQEHDEELRKFRDERHRDHLKYNHLVHVYKDVEKELNLFRNSYELPSPAGEAERLSSELGGPANPSDANKDANME